jgi:ATP adenylyltransferase/5',5'''-P-1,P-4-tetraphosphate phosphorylase II
MNLDTGTLTPDPTKQPTTPIEAAAQQLIDHVRRILTTEHTNNTRNRHEAETRATNAERQYERVCTEYQTLLTKHEALTKQLQTHNPHQTPETSPEMGDATTTPTSDETTNTPHENT